MIRKPGEDKQINETNSNSDSTVTDSSEATFTAMSKVFNYIEGKGLNIKNASYGKIRVEYVRGDDLLKVIKENSDYLAREINKICGVKIDPKSELAAQKIYEEFNQRRMMVKALRFREDGKIKYPKRLAHYEEDDDNCCNGDIKSPSHAKKQKISTEEMAKFDDKMFYVLDIHRDAKKTYFWLFVIIFVVLMYCLFPVWPYEVKIAIWWVSYIFLVLMVGLIAIRLVLHYFFYIFGIDFWFIPELFNESLGVIDSFKTVYSISKRTETIQTILIRVFSTVAFLYLAWVVYDNPQTVHDFFDHLCEIYNDCFEYGKEKIVNYGNSTAIHIRNKKLLNPLLDDDDGEF